LILLAAVPCPLPPSILLHPPGVFPDMAETLYFFQTSFDHTKAKKEGVIVPNEGSAWSHDELPISRMCTEHAM